MSIKFAVQFIEPDEELLENVSGCFRGDLVRIRKIENDWFLESSAYEDCASPDQIFAVANRLLNIMQHVTAVYGQLFSLGELGHVKTLNKDGTLVELGWQKSLTVNVYSLDALNELKQTHGDKSHGSAIVAVAMADTRLREGLALIGDGYSLRWTDIYNVFEFLGGVDTIVRKKWATRKSALNCRRTANHYRHLGSPKKYPLPANAISLWEGNSLVLDLLKKWISSEFMRTVKPR